MPLARWYIPLLCVFVEIFINGRETSNTFLQFFIKKFRFLQTFWVKVLLERSLLLLMSSPVILFRGEVLKVFTLLLKVWRKVILICTLVTVFWRIVLLVSCSFLNNHWLSTLLPVLPSVKWCRFNFRIYENQRLALAGTPRHDVFSFVALWRFFIQILSYFFQNVFNILPDINNDPLNVSSFPAIVSSFLQILLISQQLFLIFHRLLFLFEQLFLISCWLFLLFY